MTYQPQIRPPIGFNPNMPRLLASICDVCGRARNKGKHEKCSQIRKAAGFKFIGSRPGDAKVSCKDCTRVFMHGQMMGNVCRGCHEKTLAQAAGFDV